MTDSDFSALVARVLDERNDMVRAMLGDVDVRERVVEYGMACEHSSGLRCSGRPWTGGRCQRS